MARLSNPFERVLSVFVAEQITLPQLIVYVLTTPNPQVVNIKSHLVAHASQLCELLITNSTNGHQVISNAVGRVYINEVAELVDIDNKLHFAAVRASADQISGFDLPAMAQRMQYLAPNLCHVARDKSGKAYNPDEDADALGDIMDLFQQRPVDQKESAKKKRLALLTVRRTVILSIIMQTVNQKANSLQGLFGLFLHSCGTPERVISSLARAGISVSESSIYNTIKSMSRGSAERLDKLGRTKLVQHAADNFDVHMKHQLSTLEHSDTLHHLTSALLLPLHHGVKLEDLRCSAQLWESSPLNPKNGGTGQIIELDELSWKQLLDKIYGNRNIKPGELTRREEFIQWKYLHDLVYHGPEYFRQFIPLLKKPTPIEQIPITQTPIIPARAMDCNNSTVSGNIAALEQLAQQAGIGDTTKNENLEDISEYVTIFHGDLGTGDRIASAQLRRSIESTPWRRLQHVVFVPGGFHLKFAAADAIWRMALQKPEARQDPTSLMKDLAILHPKHTGIFSSPKVTYRQMTNAINNAGIVRRLDGWLNEVKRQKPGSNFTDLESFAASEPTWDELQSTAATLAKNIISNNKVTKERRRPVPNPSRDEQHENGVLLMKYFLLYDIRKTCMALSYFKSPFIHFCKLPGVQK
ncbi:hypothetical protein BDN72DRAFT_875751 [Pluteus cervinus]|uniref:Uncharacterized protein n=1 Tax=Pluteus cervinus TaxID=181527 RepID=A0ACD3B6W0_9AGAR|nr:hypothetical protein BDN72DRAFT_875751 [Pluteus cervinus]